MKSIEIFTDGACRGNPGPGGWGAILRYGDKIKEIFGPDEESGLTSNNRMELIAAIKALSSLREVCDVTLYSDSKYVTSGINEWLEGWKKNNRLIPGRKQSVKNHDLWLLIIPLLDLHSVTCVWVKGHSGHKENKRADWLANQGCDLSVSP